ncbi:MAG: PepSY domain-containing protein, partial [Firmicutes bacterium]|nr:PepSY domain-containing protein [Bacillota bacterium]
TLSGTRGDSTVDGEEDPSAKAKEITVDVRYDFTIIVDGAVQTFKDVNGGAVYPILYEGSTYLPVRAIGELMGKSVSWDGNTKTVYIGGSDSLVTDADSFNSGTVTDADSFNTAMPSKPDGGKDIEYQQQVPPSNQQQSNQPRPDEGFGKGNSNINPEKADKTDKTDKSYEADITLEEAKAAALEDADLDEDDVTFTKTKLDYDDGTLVYDIEFYTADAKYEYEINASTGAVISSDVDIKTSGAASGVSITLDEAKEIALAHAGLDSADVTFTKAKLDTDDGVKVYDIEFRYGTTEYEYEINASTGEIESYDTDTDN